MTSDAQILAPPADAGAPAAAVALLCVIGASASGASFVGSAKAGASLTVAVLTGVALLCYVAILYVLPARPENKIRNQSQASAVGLAIEAEGD